MGMRELDILLALCTVDAARIDSSNATTLVERISDYLPEAHTQLFVPSPFLQDIRPSPWEALSYNITNALLNLGSNHAHVEANVKEKIDAYIQNCIQSSSAVPSLQDANVDWDKEVEYKEAAEISTVTLSLVGFLRAVADHAQFWSISEQLRLIQQLRSILSDRFLTAVEAAASLVRSSSGPNPAFHSWRKYMRRYAALGQPMGAMLLQKGFIEFVLASTSLLVKSPSVAPKSRPLDLYLTGASLSRVSSDNIDDSMLEYLADVIRDVLKVLDEGSDYLQLGSIWQQRLALAVKASALEAFLYCMVVDEDIADADALSSWLEDTIVNPAHMANDALAKVASRSIAVIARYIPESAGNLARILLRFIVQGTSQGSAVAIAAESLAYILRMLSQDAIITTLYSLGNVLSSNTASEKPHQTNLFAADSVVHHQSSLVYNNQERAGSVLSLSMSGDEETSNVCGNVARAVVTIATSCNDPKIMALAQSMILQKMGRVNLFVDARIIEESAALAIGGHETEFKALLKFYSRANIDSRLRGNKLITEAILRARIHLAQNLDIESALYRIYLVHLLERIVTKGEMMEGDAKQGPDKDVASHEIMPLVKPLAVLLSRRPRSALPDRAADDGEIQDMVREAWFNIAVHGVTAGSVLAQEYYHDLLVFAQYTQALVDEDRAELLEGDVDLNTILRRGMSSSQSSAQKHNLLELLPSREHDIKHLTYPQLVFLHAAYLVESLRASSGDCVTILKYFLDPALQTSEFGRCLSSIADEVVRIYLGKLLTGEFAEFSAPLASRQLAQLLVGCCSRMQKVQEVAVIAADRIITQAPSVLCQKSALFALLELLTLMWSSCLEAEVDEYEWSPTLTSTRAKVTIELSDDYAFRRRTLTSFHAQSRKWVTGIICVAPLDVKGLLQTYLSEFDDIGSYGHIALGRTFASDMGAIIPPTDHRLASIEGHGDNASINIASDFIAQYTTRQEYRYVSLPDQGQSWLRSPQINGEQEQRLVDKSAGLSEEANMILSDLSKRTADGQFASIAEIRDDLRRAAALLCRSKRSQSAIIHHLVSIPFQVFDKESIKFGISLWLGVINENPRMEARILTEVALEWEKTIDRRVGIFNEKFMQKDPFYIKEEYAPSDKSILLRVQHTAQNTISPHLRLLQFFQSHFHAIRLGSPNTQRTFLTLILKTLDGFRKSKGHPLTREIYCLAVYFALQILRYNTLLTKVGQWNLKDALLSAALSWFRHPPSWSFGGNRLQVKAEIKLMTDIQAALQLTQNIGRAEYGARKSLQPRQELLHLLLENEKARLTVWLYPIEPEHNFPVVSPASISHLVRVAWAEHPKLAVTLVTRFPSDNVRRDVRFLLLNFPDKAIDVSEALEVLLGPSLPNDVNFQLRYLLYWAPVNPMHAVTYFLPAYGNHPFILQYALRALESHSIDVTFFYVPQIVQSLRYDALGYIEQYIIETGKFSQLFAHQIIWNMKANAYKDEESEVPDSVKPVLDKVMDSLIASFTGDDKDFYEREFDFFGEVTSISGKLRPFIKKSKPEKKAKIEEELRKIQVEVGVYLPSNPEGVVVGIDRKSGKPLQSHAKAPFMATFRIRKEREDEAEVNGAMVEKAKNAPHQRRAKNMSITSARSVRTREETKPTSYEVWQSAIFKVGDDCRQDVLSLQIIAAFRGIFNNCGLDVYVYPYRVTATAPGCGVIDVLPNSISRDMLGREAVNGLYEYFVTKYGGEHSIRFQAARANFVKSMAAYSVISYLLQFKDRHNGNIMVDDAGHILHIDFGFIFDIAPGGVKFERAPFKLTSEMISVMGGSTSSQSYRWFEELTVKAFLASRPYTEKLCHLVSLMLDSGLPCFKPETIANLRRRFVLEKSEREAAEHMRGLIRKSEGALSTKGYDQFQLLTNGIPY